MCVVLLTLSAVECHLLGQKLRSTAWMLGRTPPWVMLTPDRSWFNSSSFRMASWRWWGWFWSSCCHKQRYLPLSSWKKYYLIIHKSSQKKSQYQISEDLLFHFEFFSFLYFIIPQSCLWHLSLKNEINTKLKENICNWK